MPVQLTYLSGQILDLLSQLHVLTIHLVQLLSQFLNLSQIKVILTLKLIIIAQKFVVAVLGHTSLLFTVFVVDLHLFVLRLA